MAMCEFAQAASTLARVRVIRKELVWSAFGDCRRTFHELPLLTSAEVVIHPRGDAQRKRVAGDHAGAVELGHRVAGSYGRQLVHGDSRGQDRAEQQRTARQSQPGH